MCCFFSCASRSSGVRTPGTGTIADAQSVPSSLCFYFLTVKAGLLCHVAKENFSFTFSPPKGGGLSPPSSLSFPPHFVPFICAGSLGVSIQPPHFPSYVFFVPLVPPFFSFTSLHSQLLPICYFPACSLSGFCRLQLSCCSSCSLSVSVSPLPPCIPFEETPVSLLSLSRSQSETLRGSFLLAFCGRSGLPQTRLTPTPSVSLN